MKKLFVEIEDKLHEWLRNEKHKRKESYKEIIEKLIEKEMKKKKS